jgi:hypothetical protein
MIDAHDFLNHDDAAARRSRRVGAVCAEFEAIARRQNNMFAHFRFSYRGSSFLSHDERRPK